jgi:hypothetical protein
MSKASSVIIPNKIREFILHAFDVKEIRSHKHGCSSFIPDFTKAINKYIIEKCEHYSLIRVKYRNGISEDHIKRFFNYKSPNGATKQLRDAVALYATDSELDWNGLIIKYFSDYIRLLDKAAHPDEDGPPHITNYEIYLKLLDIENRLSKR